MILLIASIAAFIMNLSLTQSQENILLNASIIQTENKWRIVNDGVMGGLSSSEANVSDERIIFSGNLSLENNGGFASLRSPIKNYNFEDFSGFEIRVKGDGKRYSISMTETSYFTGYLYTCPLETKKDEWIVARIPFKEFKLYNFGKETNSSKQIPLHNIKEVSLLIGDKQKGLFNIEIDYIKLLK